MKSYIINSLAQECPLTFVFSNGEKMDFLKVTNELKDNDNLIELLPTRSKVSYLVNLNYVIFIKPLEIGKAQVIRY